MAETATNVVQFPEQMTENNVENVVRIIMETRAKLDERKREYEQSIESLKRAEQKCEAFLQGILDKLRVESIKTKYGTFHRITKYSATIGDKEAFRNYVIQNNAYELLDMRANLTAVKDFVKDNKSPPPGCNLSSVALLGVRKPKE